jgi:hypothetical protein
MCKRGISQHNTRSQNGESSSVDAYEKISYPCPERQITAAFCSLWLESVPKKEE